jgi:hypothetical protein
MRFRCRCSRKACQARKTLAKHPDDYAAGRTPRCPMCGNRKWRVDGWRHKHELHRYCWCNGAHYPHRYGSSVCLAHPHYGVPAEKRPRGVTECPF